MLRQSHQEVAQCTDSRRGRRVRGRRGLFVRPQLEKLEDRTLLDAGFTNLANAVDSRLLGLEQSLATLAQTSVKLPIIDTPIQSLAGGTQDALNQFRSSLKTILTSLDSAASESALRQALYPQLDNSGFLHDLGAKGFDDDRALTKDPATGITINVNVGFERQVFADPSTGQTFKFSLGLPGVPLSVRKGDLQVNAGFAYDRLTFGLLGNGTPFFQSTGTLSATAKAGLAAGTTIRGSLGFLEISATNAGNTGLGLSLLADVIPTRAGRFGDEVPGLTNPRLVGAADVNLNVKADFTGNNTQQGYKYPNIQSNLYMHWGFDNANPGAGLSAFGDEPDIQFRNVQFGMGTFLSDVLRPIVNTVQDVTKPLKPILDILAAELPGISDISTDVGLPPVSIESLAKLAASAGVLPPDYQLLVDVALTSIDLIRLIDDIPKGTEVLVPVGTFSLAGNNIRAKNAIDFIGGLNSGNLTDLIPVAIGAVTKLEDAIPGPFKGVFDFITNKLKSAQNGVGIDFPLLKDPRDGVFKLLLGQDVDFVNFIARFHLGASYTQLVPLWGPVNVRFDGGIDADAYFKMGYDTYGLRKFLQGLLNGKPDGGDLVAGLYFDSTKDLLRMSGSLSAGLALAAPLPAITIPVPFPPFEIPITADASINGSLSADDVSVRFGTADSKFRFLVARAEPLFQTQGLIKAGFDFVVEVGIPGVYMQELYKKTLADTTVLDLYNGPLANPANPVNVPPSAPPKQDIVLDLSGLPRRISNFGGIPRPIPDLIKIDVQTVRVPVSFGRTTTMQVVYFLVNGQEWPAAPPLPLDQLQSVRIIGSDNSDRLTVNGAVNRPVTFEATPGRLNTVTLDDGDSPPGFVDYYTVTGDGSGGDLQRRAIRGIANDTVDLRFYNAYSVGLKTSNSSPVNNVSIPALFNTRLTVQLGTTNNMVNADITGGGFADAVSIVADAVHKGTNSLAIVDRDTADTGVFLSNPATYTLHTTFAYDPVTFAKRVVDERIIREKRQFAFLGKRHLAVNYTATATISYSGIDNLAIKGGDLGNIFKTQGVNDKVRYDLTGGNGTDIFLLAPDSRHLGFANAQIHMDGGGGRDDQLILDDSANDDVPYPTVSAYTTNRSRITYEEQVGSPISRLGGGPRMITVKGRYDFDNIEHFTIKSGGFSTFDVNDTPQVVNFDGRNRIGQIRLDGDTTILGGKNFDTVNVRGTTGLLTIGGGVENVVIGSSAGQADGLLDPIRGAVTIQGQDPVNVSITDTLSTQPIAYVVDAGQFLRTDSSGVRTAAPINYSGAKLGTLSIRGGNGGFIGNTFRINDTPLTYGFTFGMPGLDINTGAGNDDVFVRGTTGAVGIDLGPGFRQNIYIGDASTSLDAIRGDILLSGGAGVSAIVNDQASTTSHSVVIDTNRLGVETIKRYPYPLREASPTGTITFGLFSRVLSNLTYTGGAAGDILGVEGNPAGTTLNANGGAGTDEFLVDASTNAILGPVNFSGRLADGDYSVYYDYTNLQTQGQTYTISATVLPATGQRVERSGLAPVLFKSMAEVVVYTASNAYNPAISGNNIVNVKGVPANEFLNMALDNRDQVTVGSAAPALGGSLVNIKGPIALAGYGDGVNVVLDDSGNRSLSPKRVTFTSPNGPYDGGNHIDGFGPNDIAWRLNEKSSLTLRGSAANETFALAGANFTTNIRIDGGGGVNTLDYSAYNGLPGLVSWYQGDGNADDTIGGNTGTLHGDVAFAPGKVGQAFSFNGVDSFVQVPTAASLDPAYVSVEAWLNSTTLGRNRYIVDKGAYGDRAASYALYTGPDSGLRFYVFDGANDFAESPDAGTDVWDGNWHHVVGTYDGANVRLYVDGAEVGNGTPTNLRIGYGLPSTDDLFIGTYNGDSRLNIYAFQGLVDEPSIYNRALDPAEVQKLFAADSAGKSAVAHGIVVNLPLGTATDVRGGIARIQNVVGSAFNDILVGNGGNVLDGGDGSDLLIAGASASTLLGGRGDDLLIAGTTAYDTDPASLDAVLAAWTQPTQDYATRVASLRNGLLTDDKFTANHGANVLSGGDGLDLFFASLDDTGDWTPDEIVVRK